MDWTTAPLVALMIFTINPDGEILDGLHYFNKPYVTCMLKADSMRAERRDPTKLPACIRIEAAQHFMEVERARLHSQRPARSDSQ